MLHHPRILGRAAGLGTRIRNQRSGVGNGAVRVFPNRFGVEFGWGEIAPNIRNADAVLAKIDG